jgi:predicted nucleic-acid-binding Zn-ribbon protein
MIIPCPFCGSTELESRQIDIPDREGVPMAVLCPDCGCVGPWIYIKQELKTTLSERALLEHIAEKSGWNKRTIFRSNTTRDYIKRDEFVPIYCSNCNEIYPLSDLDSYSIKEDREHIIAYCAKCGCGDNNCLTFWYDKHED